MHVFSVFEYILWFINYELSCNIFNIYNFINYPLIKSKKTPMGEEWSINHTPDMRHCTLYKNTRVQTMTKSTRKHCFD